MTIDLERPLRHPDVESVPLMSKRARWLVVLGFLLPGSAQLLSGNRRLGRFGLGATIGLVVALLLALLGLLTARSAVLGIVTNTWVLLAIEILLFAYAVLWLVLGFDTLRLAKLVRVSPNWRVPVAIVSVLLTVVPALGAAWAGSTIGTGRAVVNQIFQQAASVDPVDGRYNILLLGTDAGDDRAGMRPDSISLVSVDAKTGQSVIIGLPRELANMPFPDDSPMHDLHPNGFCVAPNAFGEAGGCLSTGYLNAVFTEVEQSDEIVESQGLDPSYDVYSGLYPDATSQGSSPGIEATKDAVTGATGLEVQFYVLVNMDAFSSMIDALGGVKIDVQEQLPIGGSIDEATGELVGVEDWIEPGEQVLDGYLAQWYARSRYGSSDGDYARMERQRELQSAILAQMSPQNVLLRFQDIASAGTELVETDIPDSMLGSFVDLASKASNYSPVSVELVPPEVVTEAPDYAVVRELVAAGVAEASPAAEEGDEE